VQTSRELLEAANEEIKYLTAKVAALEKLDKQNRELVDALDAQIKAQEKTIAALKAAMATGEKITGVDDKLLASLQNSLTDAKGQITRLEAKASFWRRAAAMGVMAAVGVGIAIGIAISK
jgi:chromosome segregation ATPase